LDPNIIKEVDDGLLQYWSDSNWNDGDGVAVVIMKAYDTCETFQKYFFEENFIFKSGNYIVFNRNGDGKSYYFGQRNLLKKKDQVTEAIRNSVYFYRVMMPSFQVWFPCRTLLQ